MVRVKGHKMKYLYIDFETKSSVDLKKHGAMNYFHDPDADIVCLAYRIDNDKTQLWHPGLPLSKVLKDFSAKIVAFNAQFDKRAWDILGQRYGFPKTQYSNWIDTMAICAHYTFPQGLDKAAGALGVNVHKHENGAKLIKKICKPPFEHTEEELKEFYAYCVQDVDVLYAVTKALPADCLREFL